MSLKKFICGPLDNNVYLLTCDVTKKTALIDPAQGSAKKILPYLKTEKLELDYVLLTHCHWDHIFDVHTIQKETQAKVAIHRLDAPQLIEPPHAEFFGIPKVSGAQADILLEDGQELLLGEVGIHVLHTPGHTPGGVCYYIPKENLLFSGDTLFAGTCGAMHFPGGSSADMQKSLEKLALLPKETIVLPGHGKSTTIAQETWI